MHVECAAYGLQIWGVTACCGVEESGGNLHDAQLAI